MENSKTVDRGIRLLLELADNPGGLTVTELAARLSTQRPPLYRLLRTLSDYQLVSRDKNKVYTLSIGVLALARAFYEPFLDRAQVELQRAADSSDQTALLSVADGNNLVVALCVVPQTPGVHLTVKVGSPYPTMDVGPWTAILSARPPTPEDSELVREARERGFAESFGRVRPGVGGIAVPLHLPNREASLSLVSSGPSDDRAKIVAIAQEAARTISALAAHRSP